MGIRTLLADDHRILRQGLRLTLERLSDVEIVAEAADGRAAVELARQTSPQVVVMDITMPGLNGVEATRQILADNRTVRVIALSAHADRRMVTEMLRAGAIGYVIKDGAVEELAEAIRSAVDGRVYLSPRVANVVVDEFVHRTNGNAEGKGGGGAGGNVAAGQRADEGGVFSRLTPREREVLQLIAEGKNTKQVAMVLKISVKTVETHRRAIMDKLALHSIAELTKYAIREGLTDTGP